jgi:hypothetical protein
MQAAHTLEVIAAECAGRASPTAAAERVGRDFCGGGGGRKTAGRGWAASAPRRRGRPRPGPPPPAAAAPDSWTTSSTLRAAAASLVTHGNGAVAAAARATMVTRWLTGACSPRLLRWTGPRWQMATAAPCLPSSPRAPSCSAARRCRPMLGWAKAQRVKSWSAWELWSLPDRSWTVRLSTTKVLHGRGSHSCRQWLWPQNGPYFVWALRVFFCHVQLICSRLSNQKRICGYHTGIRISNCQGAQCQDFVHPS